MKTAEESDIGLRDLNARLRSDGKPTKKEYLLRAMLAHHQLVAADKRHFQAFGEHLGPNSVSHRFIGKMLWHNLMGWAGFPMWVKE